jgi:hypothetical protein
MGFNPDQKVIADCLIYFTEQCNLDFTSSSISPFL